MIKESGPGHLTETISTFKSILMSKIKTRVSSVKRLIILCKSNKKIQRENYSLKEAMTTRKIKKSKLPKKHRSKNILKHLSSTRILREAKLTRTLKKKLHRGNQTKKENKDQKARIKNL